MIDCTHPYRLLLNIQSSENYVLLGVQSLLFGVQALLFGVLYFRRIDDGYLSMGTSYYSVLSCIPMHYLAYNVHLLAYKYIIFLLMIYRIA